MRGWSSPLLDAGDSVAEVGEGLLEGVESLAEVEEEGVKVNGRHLASALSGLGFLWNAGAARNGKGSRCVPLCGSCV